MFFEAQEILTTSPMCLFLGCYAFGVMSKKLWPIPKLWRFICMFSSKSFIVFALTFFSFIYFDFLNMAWGSGPTLFLFFFFATQFADSLFPNQGSKPGPLQWEHWVPTTGPPGKSPNFTLLLVDIQLSQHHSLKKFFFPHWMVLAPSCFLMDTVLSIPLRGSTSPYSSGPFTSGHFSSVQSLSRVWLFETPWTTAHQASLSITSCWSPPKPMSIESVMPSTHLILCHHLLLLPSILPSIRVFSNESALRIRWPKYWSFSFSISPSNEHQDWSALGWTGWISCSPRDSQESSPTPQFKSINSSALNFLYSPTLTSIHDYWKYHSLD